MVAAAMAGSEHLKWATLLSGHGVRRYLPRHQKLDLYSKAM